MAVSLYFGLPGCGKTTLLAKFALDAVRSGRYINVYTNVGLNIPGVTLIDNECIGKYELENCLLLIDEATLFADSRDFKNFSKGRLEYFLEHRHRNADIMLFTQQWDGVDRKIRTITDRVYHVKKGFFTGKWFSTCYKIPYGIIIPDPKKNGGDKLGEIIQGYCKPPLITRLFALRIYRPAYYKYFDSWELEKLPPLPSTYKAIERKISIFPNMYQWCIKRSILLRSVAPVKSLVVFRQRTHTGLLGPQNNAFVSLALPFPPPLDTILPEPGANNCACVHPATISTRFAMQTGCLLINSFYTHSHSTLCASKISGRVRCSIIWQMACSGTAACRA